MLYFFQFNKLIDLYYYIEFMVFNALLTETQGNLYYSKMHITNTLHQTLPFTREISLHNKVISILFIPLMRQHP